VLEAAGLPPEEELLDAIEDVNGAQTGPGARPEISEKISSDGSATRPGAPPDVAEKTSRDDPARKPPAAELDNNNAQRRGG
jgi:hypothetical protein